MRAFLPLHLALLAMAFISCMGDALALSCPAPQPPYSMSAPRSETPDGALVLRLFEWGWGVGTSPAERLLEQQPVLRGNGDAVPVTDAHCVLGSSPPCEVVRLTPGGPLAPGEWYELGFARPTPELEDRLPTEGNWPRWRTASTADEALAPDLVDAPAYLLPHLFIPEPSPCGFDQGPARLRWLLQVPASEPEAEWIHVALWRADQTEDQARHWVSPVVPRVVLETPASPLVLQMGLRARVHLEGRSGLRSNRFEIDLPVSEAPLTCSRVRRSPLGVGRLVALEILWDAIRTYEIASAETLVDPAFGLVALGLLIGLFGRRRLLRSMSALAAGGGLLVAGLDALSRTALADRHRVDLTRLVELDFPLPPGVECTMLQADAWAAFLVPAAVAMVAFALAGIRSWRR